MKGKYKIDRNVVGSKVVFQVYEWISKGSLYETMNGRWEPIGPYHDFVKHAESLIEELERADQILNQRR